jgi:hypothetical protein
MTGATGDWKVARTRRQECPRYVAQAFQSRHGGILATFQSPVARRKYSLAFPETCGIIISSFGEI